MLWMLVMSQPVILVSETYKSVFVDENISKKESYEFKIKGVMCEGCVKKIEKALRKVKGVLGMEYIWEKRILKVWHDGKLNPKDVEKAVRKAGYGCEMVKKDESDT